MEKKKKVSFDFDGTLGKKEVEDYAKHLVSRGFEVWIVTSRYDSIDKYSEKDQKDWKIKNLPIAWSNLFILADMIGINEEHIYFTNCKPKMEFFTENDDFLFHLDNDMEEWKEINLHTKVTSVHYKHKNGWKGMCECLMR